MALRLELDFDKKKEPTPVLDLSKFKIVTRQDFDKACEKVPDYKIKPEKVRYEDVKPQESHFSFAPSRAEILAAKEYNNPSSSSGSGQQQQGGGTSTGGPGTGSGGPNEFPFGNPVPPSMRSVRIEDLSSVDINWRMLTLARPKTKLEEDIFSRFVALDKIKRKTRQAEGDQVPPQKQIVQSKGSSGGRSGGGKSGGGKGSSGSSAARTSAAGGAVPETRFPSCKECGDELCTGGCKDFHYDASERIVLEDKEKDGDKQDEGLNLSALLDGPSAGAGRKGKKKGREGGMSHHIGIVGRRKKKKKAKKPRADDGGNDDDEDEDADPVKDKSKPPKVSKKGKSKDGGKKGKSGNIGADGDADDEGEGNEKAGVVVGKAVVMNGGQSAANPVKPQPDGKAKANKSVLGNTRDRTGGGKDDKKGGEAVGRERRGKPAANAAA